MFATGALEGYRRRPHPIVLILAVISVGASAYGMVWTLGWERALVPGAFLVYVGMIGTVVLTEVARRSEGEPS